MREIMRKGKAGRIASIVRARERESKREKEREGIINKRNELNGLNISLKTRKREKEKERERERERERRAPRKHFSAC